MYRIKTVSDLTGIPKNTIVAWERRYGIPEPVRQDNGYRFYSDADVALILQLKSALGDGLKISEAVERLKHRHASPAGERLPDTATPSANALGAIADELRAALLAFDRDRGDEVVERMMIVPYATAIDEVYYPLLRRVGDGWEKGEVTVAQEHFASSFVRDQLVSMLLRVGSGPAHGKHVVCTTFPGETHELGVLGLSVRLALGGARVTYLGADLPLAELVRFATEQRPVTLFISVITSVEAKVFLAYARKLRAGIPEATAVVLGGAGLPDLGQRHVEGVRLLGDWHELDIG